MTLPVFAINLDRSRHRWERLSASAAAQSIALTRVPGVDGKAIAPEARSGASERLFRRRAGRTIRPGEYGCYQSHLHALKALCDSGARAGVIIEDDIRFAPDFMARTEALLDTCPDAGVIKLVNHRIRGFRKRSESRFGDPVGRCLHGPQGSAACYLVTADAARRLLSAMQPMGLPYDVELERGWATGVPTYTTGHDLAVLDPLDMETEIGTREDYRATRLSPIKRLPTHLFRIGDYARRLLYCFTS